MLVNDMSLDRDVGALEARIGILENDLQAIRRDVREIRDVLVGARGGWKTLTVVIGASVWVGAIVGKLVALMSFMQ